MLLTAVVGVVRPDLKHLGNAKAAVVGGIRVIRVLRGRNGLDADEERDGERVVGDRARTNKGLNVGFECCGTIGSKPEPLLAATWNDDGA